MLPLFMRSKLFLVNFCKFLQILIILSTIQITTLQLSVPPLSFYDYAPNLVEGGKVSYVKGTAPDNDASTIFNSTYTVTLQRMKNQNANSYLVVIGLKLVSIDIPNYPMSLLGFMILVQNMTSTSFGCLGWANYEPYFSLYEVSYLAISREIGNIYFFSQILVVNQVLVYPAFLDYTITDTNIKQTGRPYFVIQSIFQFALGYTTASSHALATYVLSNTTNTYTIRLYSTGLHISAIGVQGLIFDPILLNDFKRQHIFLYTQYYHSAPLGYFIGFIHSHPGIALSPRNVFFGLFLFYSDSNKLDYKFNLITNQVQLTKQPTCPILTIHILVHLRNHCPDPFRYDQGKGECRPCMDNCLKCDQDQCLQCAFNFTLTSDFTQCQCQQQLVSGICYEFDKSPMKGCTSAQMTPDGIKCKMCSAQQKLILTQNECKCINGYELDSGSKCIQTCGDGKNYEAQCDDGNLLNGDGCSSTCKYESDFKCGSSQPTSCKFNQELKFKPISIMKNRNNSAIITLGTDIILLFGLTLDHFTDKNGKKMFNLSMAENGSFVMLETYLMSVEKNQLTFLVNYDSTIECTRSLLNLDLSNTKYTPETTSAEFSMCGDNEPLELSEHWETFMKTQTVYNAFGILIFILLFLGLCTPKFIGLEAILTLQLIFYSCLLIKDIGSIPVGFKTFTAFKFSTGFNDLVVFTNIYLSDVFERKIVWMGLQKTVVQNYNISFGILILAMLLMVCSIIYRLKKEGDFDGRFINFNKGELKQMQLGLSFAQKMNETTYNLMSQISYWSILQVIAAISIQSLINNKNVHVSQLNEFFKLGSLMAVAAIMLVFSVGLNNFWNTILSAGSWGRLAVNQHVITYKQVKFVYLVLMGVIIFPLNSIVFFKFIPISVVALLVHIVYMIILIQVKPYKTSLKVHKYGLFICEYTILIFLIIINLVNFLPKSEQFYSLIFVYLIVGVCVIIVIFTIIRLYYEYKYGAELENKIKKQREIQIFRKASEQENQLKKKLNKIQGKIQQKLEQKQKQRLQNQFLYENQIRQDLMKDEIQFLDKRPNITKEKKEMLYYQKFQAKPLDWLKKHNIQEQSKDFQGHQMKKNQQMAKRLKKQSDPEYIKVVKRLKHQFKHFKN